MAEELQHLLETIQKDGIEKAQAEAEKIIAKARQEAQQIIQQAQSQAKQVQEAAERAAREFQERGQLALQQAARDVLISLGREVERLMQECLREQVGEALSLETLKQLLVQIADTYFRQQVDGGHVDLCVSEKDESALIGFVDSQLRAKFAKGVSLRASPRITKGVQVSLKDKDVYHEFTQDTLAEALCQFVRPRLQEIVRRVVSSGEEA